MSANRLLLEWTLWTLSIFCWQKRSHRSIEENKRAGEISHWDKCHNLHIQSMLLCIHTQDVIVLLVPTKQIFVLICVFDCFLFLFYHRLEQDRCSTLSCKQNRQHTTHCLWPFSWVSFFLFLILFVHAAVWLLMMFTFFFMNGISSLSVFFSFFFIFCGI